MKLIEFLFLCINDAQKVSVFFIVDEHFASEPITGQPRELSVRLRNDVLRGSVRYIGAEGDTLRVFVWIDAAAKGTEDDAQ